MAKFERLTFPSIQPDARLAQVIVPPAPITHRDPSSDRDAEDRPALPGPVG
ncbi:hypothetical protein ACTI_65200 [Actinoplanes sp. OR16]|uniref:hypothetical protein n=1 Tax=Actinoplanes sp. OR16 TaxID=946334 RepID=UPI000F706912|nr:hypothetical protein [Actinoplanes sp. OR16]BBH69835.1 hypothetical protein ACTI_65200 [Actinoplanes sp. OR16]